MVSEKWFNFSSIKLRWSTDKMPPAGCRCKNLKTWRIKAETKETFPRGHPPQPDSVQHHKISSHPETPIKTPSQLAAPRLWFTDHVRHAWDETNALDNILLLNVLLFICTHMRVRGSRSRPRDSLNFYVSNKDVSWIPESRKNMTCWQSCITSNKSQG